MDDTTLAQHNRELVILNQIAEALNRSLQLDEALHTTLQLVTELFAMRTAWIWLLRPDGAWDLSASLHLPPVLIANPQAMEGPCYCLDTFKSGDLAGAANINVVTCSRLKHVIDGTDGLRYHASVPLYAHGRSIGVLNVASNDWRQLSPADLRLLHTIGDLVSIAIERTQLFERSVALGAVEERNRLAREIHDTLAQSLAALLLQLETIDLLLERGADLESTRQRLRQAITLTRKSSEEARRSLHDLRAAPLEGRTLVEALTVLAAEVQEQSGVLVLFQPLGWQRALPTHLELGVYRIVQEALTNVRRHAKATTVRIDLDASSQTLTLCIEDDGCGFDLAARPATSFGLKGLGERVDLLAGVLQIQSHIGQGTRINVTIPLTA